MVNISVPILFHASNTPERAALAYEGRTINYGTLADSCRVVAALLIARGVQPGDRVATVMKNSPAFIVIALAVSHVGAVFLPINFRLANDEVDYIVGNAEAVLVFCDAELADRTTSLEAIIIVDGEAQADARLLGSVDSKTRFPIACQPDDLYRLMYTSGTTDHPKGVMHSYANAAWKGFAHSIALNLSASDRLLIAGPLYHVGAFDLPGITVLALGGYVSLLRDFDPVEVMRAIDRDRISGVWLAPVMMNSIIDTRAAHEFDVSSLQWCIAGGERSVEGKIRQFGSIFPNARFIDAYGLTESCGGDTFMPAGREFDKIGSVGRAVPFVDVEVRDVGGAALPIGQEGEICLHGPKVTKSYWRNPEKTRESFWGDWFRTGDIGVLDEEGFLTVTDRAKDMIISGGENIASSEVERVAYELPQIAEAAVIGLPDHKWGERAVLVAVLKHGDYLDIETAAAFFRDRLAAFKVPKELHLRDALPRNPSGKVLKRVLRDELIAARADGGRNGQG